MRPFCPCALKSQNSRINKLWQDEMVNEKKLVSGGGGKTNSRLTSHKEPLHGSFLPVSRSGEGLWIIPGSQAPFRSHTFTVMCFFGEANKPGSLNFSVIFAALCIV